MFCVLIGASVVAAGQEGGVRPNVLLVSFDTTRADALGCYGSDRGASPVVDRLAAEGVVFDQAFSPVPMTLPAHATMLTGLDPPRHGVRDNGVYRLSPEAETLAELLAAAGYRTLAAVSALVLAEQFGLAQGFEVYAQGSLDAGASPPVLELPAQSVADALLRALPGAEPWFGLVHFYDPHQPYDPPPDLAERYREPLRDLYYAEIAAADRALGRIVEHLEAEGQLERTLVIVTADHGEGRGEHFEITHGHLLHDATQRVPLVFRHPSLAPRRVSGPLVTLADLSPTVLELAGVPPPAGLDGASLVPLLRGEEVERDDVVYLETVAPLQSYDLAPLFGVRTPEWKLAVGARPHLFDLEEDPAEDHDVAEARPEVVAGLSAKLQALRDERGPALASVQYTMSWEEERALGGLGYVVGAAASGVLEDPARADPYDHAADLALYNDAQILVKQERFAEALPLFEKLARSLPGSFLVRHNLGICHERQGRWPEALAEYQAAEKLRPDSAVIQTGVGIAALRTGDVALATTHLERALTLNASPANAYFALSECYRRKGDRLRARAVLEAVLSRKDLSDQDRARARALLR